MYFCIFWECFVFPINWKHPFFLVFLVSLKEGVVHRTCFVFPNVANDFSYFAQACSSLAILVYSPEDWGGGAPRQRQRPPKFSYFAYVLYPPMRWKTTFVIVFFVIVRQGPPAQTTTNMRLISFCFALTLVYVCLSFWFWSGTVHRWKNFKTD